jgi:hypothetical protein
MNMFSHVTTNSQLTTPVITSVNPANLKAIVNFIPSRGNNVINYLYSTNSGQTFTAFSPAQKSTPCTITGLSNGITYGIQLEAIASNMTSPASNLVSVIPNFIPFSNYTATVVCPSLAPYSIYGGCCSVTGQYVMMCIVGQFTVTGSTTGYGIWASRNYGVSGSWYQTNAPSTTAYSWWEMCCDSTGQYVYAVGRSNNGTFFSQNGTDVSGATFTLFKNASAPKQAYSVCCNASGNFLAICDYGNIWTCNNALDGSNVSFTNITQMNSLGNWRCICCSANGQYLAVGSYGNKGIWTSQNYGVSGSWYASNAPIGGSYGFVSICCDPTGNYIAACCEFTGGILISINGLTPSGGVIFKQVITGNYLGICCDSTFKYIAISSTSTVSLCSNGLDQSNNLSTASFTPATNFPTGSYPRIRCSSNAQYVYTGGYATVGIVALVSS